MHGDFRLGKKKIPNFLAASICYLTRERPKPTDSSSQEVPVLQLYIKTPELMSGD